MQTNLISRLGVILSCLSILASGLTGAEKSVEGASLITGKMMIVEEGGKTVPMEENVVLPGDIKVSTNGTFTVKGGKKRTLQEGQVLDKEGMLTSPDGSVVPVVDHITMKKGQLLVVQDGDSTPLDHEILFPDGSKIVPDGTLRTRDGRLKRLIDGDLLKLDGEALPTRDTITLLNGTVVVQKDGSPVKLSPNQTIMMNDGTKVFGNGTVLMKDGSKVTLSEGQIVPVEGVVAPRK
jgi:uncharacterized cupin superfamily protein